MVEFIADNYEFFKEQCRKMVGEYACDLLHDVMLELHEKPLDGIENPKGYVCMALYYASLKMKKEASKTVSLVGDVKQPDFEGENWEKMVGAEIDILLDRLDPFNKYVYIARNTTGFKEVSEKTGIPLRTLYHNYKQTEEIIKKYFNG